MTGRADQHYVEAVFLERLKPGYPHYTGDVSIFLSCCKDIDMVQKTLERYEKVTALIVTIFSLAFGLLEEHRSSGPIPWD